MAVAVGLARAAAWADDLDPFLGRWDMTLHTPAQSYACWLEVVPGVTRAPRVRFVSRWGHARWLPKAEISRGHLFFTSPAAEEGTEQDVTFDTWVEGGRLAGVCRDWTVEAVPAPSLSRAHVPRWGPPVSLFDGATLAGWSPRDSRRLPWHVEKGLLVTPGSGGSDLLSAMRLSDFQLHVEFRIEDGANSGVYLRGRYEVQLEMDVQPEAPSMRTGGIYGWIAPNRPVPRIGGVWHVADITLIGRRVTEVIDGQTLIAAQEIPGLTGGALDSAEEAPGPIMLQGSETGRVEFRRIVVNKGL